MTAFATAGLSTAELNTLSAIALRWHANNAVGSVTGPEQALLTRLSLQLAEHDAATTADPQTLRDELIATIDTDSHALGEALSLWFSQSPDVTDPADDIDPDTDTDLTAITDMVTALHKASGLDLLALWARYDTDTDQFLGFLGLHLRDQAGRLFTMSSTWRTATPGPDLPAALTTLSEPTAWLGELCEYRVQRMHHIHGVHHALSPH